MYFFGVVDFGSETTQTFLVNIYFERVVRSDYYVDSQVVFVPIDKMGVRDIF